ncbi:MAG: S9 family peptidase [Candidatus Aminicenantes bacterium]|nr:S9 family peptidase [Candidatus Aminicenantes bacterium]
MRSKIFLLCFVFLIGGLTLLAQEQLTYQLPPKEIVELVDNRGNPYVRVSPDGKTLLIIEPAALASIKEVSQPELKLAGLRINPRTNGPSRGRYYKRITFKNLKKLKEIPITGLPENPQISNTSWSTDGRRLAFTLTRDQGVELWVAHVKDGKAEKLTGAIVNTSMLVYRAFDWLPDSKRLIFASVPKDRGGPPVKDPVPKGPVVQSNTGKKAPVRTYQDLLKNKHAEELFSYYATSQLAVVDLEKKLTPLGKPGIINDFSFSPDGNYIKVEVIQKPFSYSVPFYKFPFNVEIWDSSGNLIKTMAKIPLADDVPKGFDAVRKGPRYFTWRGDAAAVLYWAEAQDGGDPAQKAEIRDKVFFQKAPFTGSVREGPALKYRYGGIRWGSGKLAILYEIWWKTRRERRVLLQPDFPGKVPRLLVDRSWEDLYNDPGSFVMIPGKSGQRLLLTADNGRSLYLVGRGASPQGDRPFLDKFNLETKKTTRLWRSKAPYYENIPSVFDIKKHKILTRRESTKIQPNYFIRNLKTGKLKQVTHFPHPYPKLKDVEKQLIKYKREDGVDLSGKLYLPPGYKKGDGPLPVLMWAYPQEFKSKAAAGQVTDSPYRFLSLWWGAVEMWVTQGYAVFDDPGMPIVGEDEKEPNDTFVKQLVSSAGAAIDKLVEMGIADRKRVAIGGHSYGAFMTGNLLSHSRLFAAGIARSGAYNRTLTPFGFQREERTLWEAIDIYIAMSPFMHAHKVKDPILLIHGEMDNNSGTFPIQSKRYYHALKGHGATVRLVMLPFESHGYRARESVLHMLWETYNWLEKYVKNK